MFRKFTKLNRNELSDLLKFLNENPKEIFNSIESPINQGRGWSSSITGGKYTVKGTTKSTEYDVRIMCVKVTHVIDGTLPELELQARQNSFGFSGTGTEKYSLNITKSIPYNS